MGCKNLKRKAYNSKENKKIKKHLKVVWKERKNRTSISGRCSKKATESAFFVVRCNSISPQPDTNSCSNLPTLPSRNHCSMFDSIYDGATRLCDNCNIEQCISKCIKQKKNDIPVIY